MPRIRCARYDDRRCEGVCYPTHHHSFPGRWIFAVVVVAVVGHDSGDRDGCGCDPCAWKVSLSLVILMGIGDDEVVVMLTVGSTMLPSMLPLSLYFDHK